MVSICKWEVTKMCKSNGDDFDEDFDDDLDDEWWDKDEDEDE